MTLADIRRACQIRTGWNDTAFDDQWRTWINEAIREHARVQPWDSLEDLITVVSTGSEYLYLPGYVDSVVSILNVTDKIPVRRTGDWDRNQPSILAERATGTVYEYDKIGVVPAIRDPSGYLVLVGTHASDTMALSVSGLVANSGASGSALAASARTLSVSATGTSPQTLSSLFTRITSFAKETNSNGEFFLYDAGASNAHASWLGSSDSQAAFRRIQLLFKPASQTTFQVRVRYAPAQLVNDSDSPHPGVKNDFVLNHAIGLFYLSQEQMAKAGFQEQKAQKVLQDEVAKENLHNEPHSQITPYRPRELDDPYYYWQ